MLPVNEENNPHLPESNLIIINNKHIPHVWASIAINYLPPLYCCSFRGVSLAGFQARSVCPPLGPPYLSCLYVLQDAIV